MNEVERRAANLAESDIHKTYQKLAAPSFLSHKLLCRLLQRRGRRGSGLSNMRAGAHATAMVPVRQTRATAGVRVVG